MKQVDYSKYDNSDFDIGASKFKWALWFIVNAVVVRNTLNPFMSIKRSFLRMFGAQIGNSVIVKPGVNIKFPWRLTVGDHVWIGENVWIDNLGTVILGNNVCLSQGAVIMTGNHDYKKESFDLMVKPVTIEEGAWIGAGAIVSPGVTCKSHSVLSVNSAAVSDLEPYSIYQGNPAQKTRDRVIE